jgi:uncharacterized membrane protein
VIVGAVAHGNEVSGPQKGVRLSESESGPFSVTLDGAHHEEQHVVIAFQLRPLVCVVGILDRQLVKAYFAAYLFQAFFVGFVEADPDETVRRLARSSAIDFV